MIDSDSQVPQAMYAMLLRDHDRLLEQLAEARETAYQLAIGPSPDFDTYMVAKARALKQYR